MPISTLAHINAQEFKRITNVSRETFSLYETWYNLLTHWNNKINLVSANTIRNYWLRHALDSWQVFAGLETHANIAPLLASGYAVISNGEVDNNGEIPDQVWDDRPPKTHRAVPFNILDLGSGAGFPGLAAAIHFKDTPNAHVYLVEANGKKCNFLRAVIRELGLSATAIQARAESVPETLKSIHFSVITARAFAPLPKLLEYSAPYWRVDKISSAASFQRKLESETGESGDVSRPQIKSGVTEGEGAVFGRKSVQTLGIFPKGRNWQEEVDAARKVWDFDLETHQSRTDDEAKILWVRNLVKLEGKND